VRQLINRDGTRPIVQVAFVAAFLASLAGQIVLVWLVWHIATQ
jgi:hypothetical protein